MAAIFTEDKCLQSYRSSVCRVLGIRLDPSMVHFGSSMVRIGSSMMRLDSSMVRIGSSIVRIGTSMVQIEMSTWKLGMKVAIRPINGHHSFRGQVPTVVQEM